MSNFKVIAILLLFFLYEIKCNCILNVKTGANRPLLVQKFGSKRIILSKHTNSINLKENEHIEAYCGSGFDSYYSYDGYYGERLFDGEKLQKLDFECYTSKIYFDDASVPNRRYLYNNPTIACKGSTYAMFESKDTLPNCNDAVSYLLGAKTNTPIILAALCYDLDKLNLNYLNYVLQNRSALLEKTVEHYPTGIKGNSLLEPIRDIERFFYFPSNNDVKNFFVGQSNSNFWLSVADYEKANILQIKTNYNEMFSEYSNMLDIIWWHPLRIGNWKRLIKLLEKQAEGVSYITYSGTSGDLETPKGNDCQKATNMEINFIGGKKNVPLLIWTYLVSTDVNIVEDFVVIGYNSPYFDYFPKNSTVICNDMCDSIEWLKEMKDSRYISTFGVVYCCHPEEVADQLDGFPRTFNETNAIVETAAKPAV